jgi:hypothetical protein
LITDGEPPPPDAAIVIVDPDSVTVTLVPPDIVTAVDPDVLDVICESLAPPAPTVNDPSLVTLPSTSVAVNVITLPDSEIARIPAAVNVTSVEPDVFDEITDVVPVPAPTVNDPSLVTLPSTSVAVIVMLPDVAENETIPPAVNVTSVPVLEFSVTGDDAPENVKSVVPPELSVPGAHFEPSHFKTCPDVAPDCWIWVGVGLVGVCDVATNANRINENKNVDFIV